MPSKKEIKEIVNFEIINQDDLIFTHACFVQCFLPVRSLPKEQDFYKVRHGNASFAIQAGNLINPKNLDEWEKQEVPAGAKARLLFTYINDYAIRMKSSIIDMGKSLRNFMDKNGIPITGRNAKEITRQAKNIAACQLLIGVWGEKKATQSRRNVINDMTFWLGTDMRNKIVWDTTMSLSTDYMESLRQYKVPLDFRALVGLQANPRAMDIYCWLSYRLRTVKTNVKIPYVALHPIFGQGIKQLKHFKIEFKNAVMEAYKFYPTARIEIRNDKDYIVLKNSLSPIPHKSIIGHGKPMIPRK